MPAPGPLCFLQMKVALFGFGQTLKYKRAPCYKMDYVRCHNALAFFVLFLDSIEPILRESS